MLPPTLQHMKSLGHTVFERGDYNLNIVGVRKRDGEPGKWDDHLAVFYKRGALWNSHHFECTVDPGLFYLNKRVLNVKGTAILYPGQYRGAFEKGLHRGRYSSLVQCKPVKIWRDVNRDQHMDTWGSPTEAGLFGINIHKAHPTKVMNEIGAYSAGCTVVRRANDFNFFMGLIDKSVEITGYDRFTYTLLEEWQF